MIPKIVHYVWVGGPLPPYQQSFVDTWRSSNPDYEFVLWNEQNIDFSTPMIREAYKHREWAKVADIVRLMAVAQQGGIYLDTDFRLFSSLDPVRVDKCFFAFQQEKRSGEWVGNAAFGAEAGNTFIRKALDGLLAMKKPLFGLENPTRYGPQHITRLLVEGGLQHYSPSGVKVGEVFVHPTPVFYPYHWTEKFTPDKMKSETIGAHIWSDVPSWQGSLHPLIRFVRSSKRSIRKLIYRPL